MTEAWPGVTWGDLRAQRPDIEAVARELLFAPGVGLGFLATVRADGGPRVHPITPTIVGAGIFALIIPGPKLRDLERDRRYALHSETVPPPNSDDGAYLAGRVRMIEDEVVRAGVRSQLATDLGLESLWPEAPSQTIVEFLVERCLITLTAPRGGLPAGNTIARFSPP
jgi:hypothetical protein